MPEVKIPQPHKMRIRLYSKDGSEISDRLVEQTTELRIGPKETHNGPLTIEFNLTSQEEVDAMVEYIRKLKGDLPITTTSKPAAKSAKSLDKMLSAKEPLLDLLKTLKAKAKNQEDLVSMLREYGYKFIATDVIKDYAKPEMITLKEKHESYQWMVRLVKEAKDPANDKWDYRLVFGIKFMGEKVEKVQVYLWGKWQEAWKLPWKEKEDINFKKVNRVYIFPDWMDYAERKKWRVEHRKILAAAEKGNPIPEEKYSKLYLKCKPYIQGLER
jgi:hypothetical protein